MPFAQVELVVDPKVRRLCIEKYPDHPNGCPNYDMKEGCPPKVPMIGKVILLQEPVFAIWSVFDLAAHVERLRYRHPKWSPRQLACCLYWQPKARKALEWETLLFLRQHPGNQVIKCPEAMGVNVTATMARIGVHLEWPPERVTHQVAIGGTPAVREELSDAERLLRSLPDDDFG